MSIYVPDAIEKEFEFLITRGYCMERKGISSMNAYIIFSKPSIKLRFFCEPINYYFDFEISVKVEDMEFSICEWKGRMEMYYENKKITNVIHKSIFDYVSPEFNKHIFQSKKEEIYKPKFKAKTKSFLELLQLYKPMLAKAIINIENTFWSAL